MTIAGLNTLGTKEATDTALELASKMVYDNYIGYQQQGAMFEKVRL